MKLGIMQPYFVPYIGYWQLMNLVDQYVIYDDVNFIKGGWINRNRILVNGVPKYFNVPMLGASSNVLINEVKVDHNEAIIRKSLRSIEGAYSKAPYFESVYPMLEAILWCEEESIARYIENSFRVIGKYLDIQTELIFSSDIEKDNNLKGQDKVLAICRQLNATEYYNAIGGQELYSYEAFRKYGIQLNFVKTQDIVYDQFGKEFQPNLSIIDVLMFSAKDKVKDYLKAYILISEQEC